MENHFTWFHYFGIEHAMVPVAAGVFAMFAIILVSVVANLALGRGEAAIQPAGHLSIKGFFEAFLEFIDGMNTMVLGPHSRHYLPLFGAVFFYIMINNLIGLFPGMAAATSNINATLSIGLFIFVVYNTIGIRHAGLHYFKQFLGPVWWLVPLLLPIEIISHAVRPMSLGLRLSINMTADHAILGTFTELTKIIVPVIFYGLGTFVSLVQAFVFTMLSMVYVKMATSDHH